MRRGCSCSKPSTDAMKLATALSHPTEIRLLERQRRSASSLLFAVCLLLGTGMAAAQPAGYESFENGLPAYFAAPRTGGLSVTPWHSKHGTNSLRWEWSRGGELILRHDLGDVSRTGGFLRRAACAVWVHLEKPNDGALVFEFREGERVTGSFRFPMQFTGWRPARLHYDDFPTGKPTSRVDNIRIAAPTDVAQGVVYFDVIAFNSLTYPSAAINPEKLIPRQARPYLDEQRFPALTRVSDAELEGLRKMKGPAPKARKSPGLPEAKVTELCDQPKELGITRDERGVHGPGLDGRGYYCAPVGEYGAKIFGSGRTNTVPTGSSWRTQNHSPSWLHSSPQPTRPATTSSNAVGWRRLSCSWPTSSRISGKRSPPTPSRSCRRAHAGETIRVALRGLGARARWRLFLCHR